MNKTEIKASISANISTNNNPSTQTLAINNSSYSKISSPQGQKHFPSPQKNKQTKSPAANEAITTKQAEYFRTLVKRRAKCEKTTPLKIHNHLKKKFNYHSYLDLNQIKFSDIIHSLENLPCPENKPHQTQK